jgi:ParB family chromosome partitioning protein
MVRNGRISAGHARAVLASSDPENLARRIVSEGLNVREAEALARRPADAPKPKRPKPGKAADTLALERDLSERLGLHVEIADRDGKGEVHIRYRSLEQLDDLCRRLSGR